MSTLKLVDDLAEQEILERLIDESKPVVPVECRHLDYLLATPFRYGSVYPNGSRFRRAGRTPGVYYAAEAVEIAVAEMAFYRLLFHAESPETPWPVNAAEFTAFSAHYTTGTLIDLTAPPLDADARRWRDPVDYGACQVLADRAREAGIEILRYVSVRDLRGGANLAILACTAFARPQPMDWQTWRLRFGDFGAQALCEFPHRRIAFTRRDFAGDPRLR